MKSQQPKRALFLFPTDVMGGAENVTRMVAEAALKSNLFDEIVCFVLSQETRGTLDYLTEDPRTKLIYSGAKSEKIGFLSLFRFLPKQPYDFVFSSHTHVNSVASLMRRLGLLKTRRLVSRESTMIFERDMGWFGWIVRKMYWLYGGQNLIVCQTDRMQQSLEANTKNRFGKRVQTIPNPIDIEAINRAIASATNHNDAGGPTTRKIAWCGRLSAVKSPLRAVDALAELHDSGDNNTHLVMIGDGPMRSEILEYSQSRGLSDHITLTGRVAAPSATMQHCELGLMTSDTEGFPNVILEMLASGVRSVVTTDCAGGLSEIPGVYVSQEKTAQALAKELGIQLEQTEQDARVENYLEQRSPDKFLKRLLQE